MGLTLLAISLIQFKISIKKFYLSIIFCTFALENKEAYTSATCITFKKRRKHEKVFVFYGLGIRCYMPSQANAAEMASPVVNPVKTAAPVSLASTEDDDVVIIIIIIEQPDDGGGLTTL